MMTKSTYELPKGRTDDEIVAALDQCLDREAERIEQTIALLLGRDTGWIPKSNLDRVKRIIGALLHQYSPEQIARFVDEAGRDELPPHIEASPIYELAHIRYAETKGPEERLAILTDDSIAGRVQKGDNYGLHQSIIAQNPRGKVGDDGETVTQIIGALAMSREYAEESPKELWPRFFAALRDDAAINPKEFEYPGNFDKSGYMYDFKGKQKSITFGTFKKVVSEIRTGKKKLL